MLLYRSKSGFRVSFDWKLKVEATAPFRGMKSVAEITPSCTMNSNEANLAPPIRKLRILGVGGKFHQLKVGWSVFEVGLSVFENLESFCKVMGDQLRESAESVVQSDVFNEDAAEQVLEGEYNVEILVLSIYGRVIFLLGLLQVS